MQVGVIYPQTELPTDPGTVRAYVERAEALGYRHVVVFDHVLGADRQVYPEWQGPYDLDSTFHEPMVFYGFLAAVTKMELVTGIVISPQRQTALLAKQAAEVDVLSEGRLRLGIGVGWNRIEYEALGQDFTKRGPRQEEQISLMRRLWSERSVTFEGRFDRVVGAGIAPLPVQRPIPIWLGGSSPAAYRKIGRLAEGWFPQVVPGRGLEEARAAIAEAAGQAGRDPASIGLEGRVNWAAGGLDAVIDHADRWRQAGATHLAINTMGAGLAGLEDHLGAIESFAGALHLN